MTNIEWTEQTWNPIVGCSKVSQGCKHCYAETMAKRLKAMGKPQYKNVINGRWTGKIEFVESALDKPLKRKKPTMYFVNSMSDMFHSGVKPDMLKAIWDVMEQTPQHTYQILTKRALRMNGIFNMRLLPALPNVWLGVSVEDQQTADERIPFLVGTPVAVKFLSCEPLLGPVQLELLGKNNGRGDQHGDIDWVIVGGESGPGARPMQPEWARSIRDQCLEAGTAFFFKQWGEQGIRAGKKRSGNLLDGVEWMQYPSIMRE